MTHHRAAWPLVALLLAAASARAGDGAPTREHIVPPGAERAYHTWHYAPVVKA